MWPLQMFASPASVLLGAILIAGSELGAARGCSGKGGDPFGSGQPCCEGLSKCLKNWGHGWSFRCYASSDPEAQGAKCDGAAAPASGSSPAPQSSPPPGGVPQTYYPHFDTSPDYLNIAARAKGVDGKSGSVGDNFYLVIGDQGGAAGGCGQCGGWQRQVAEQMKGYVSKRRQQNPNSELLFVITVGDSFYWTGARPGRFQSTWKSIYGEELTSVPWFAVMGNHDFGNDDPGSACGWRHPRHTCDESNKNSVACGGAKPYSTERQSYAGNQINADKGGVDGEVRGNYHMPDYTYYYTIPQLDFELVAIDMNSYDWHGMGGNGADAGAKNVRDFCGGSENFQHALEILRHASDDLFNERASSTTAKSVAIIGHYPPYFQKGRNMRSEFLRQNHGGAKVFDFYGHTHVQKCEGKDAGECVSFLTGGAGGCCDKRDVPVGFVAISFGHDKRQKVECFAPDSRCTQFHLNLELGSMENRSEICEHTQGRAECSSSEILM